MLRYSVGRVLQIVGLFVLPFAIVSELLEKVGLGRSLLMAAAGAAIFYAGYLIQPRR